jgi:hypothetical protein
MREFFDSIFSCCKQNSTDKQSEIVTESSIIPPQEVQNDLLASNNMHSLNGDNVGKIYAIGGAVLQQRQALSLGQNGGEQIVNNEIGQERQQSPIENFHKNPHPVRYFTPEEIEETRSKEKSKDEKEILALGQQQELSDDNNYYVDADSSLNADDVS